MSAVGGKIKLLRVVREIVFLKEPLELFPRGKLDPAWTVDVHVPSARLFPVLPLLQFPYPSLRQSLVTKLEDFWQMCGSPTYLNVAVVVSGDGVGCSSDAGSAGRSSRGSPNSLGESHAVAA